MPTTNFVAVNGSNQWILDKIEVGIFSIFEFLAKPFMNKNYPTSRASNGNDIKVLSHSKLGITNAIVSETKNAWFMRPMMPSLSFLHELRYGQT